MLRSWKRGGLAWRELARRVGRQLLEDEVFDRAAQLAYYFLFSLFPLLIFLTAVFGYVAGQSAELRSDLFAYLGKVLPSPEATRFLRDTLQEVIEARGGAKLSLGLLMALWFASTGMMALTRSLNAAFDITESRPLWRLGLVAVTMTTVFGLLSAAGLTLILYGAGIGRTLSQRLGFAELLPGWSLVQWLVVIVAGLLAFESVYNAAPNRKWGQWRWLTPGGAAALGLWLAASLALRVYLAHFDTYSRTYGSLGVVVALLTWFYLTGVALLVGGEVNSEIEKAETGGER